MKKTTYILIILLTSIHLSAAETATIVVKSDKVNPHKISPYLNGGFIEFVIDFVNGTCGIWSQELTDRGFDYILGNGKHESWNYWHSPAGNYNFTKKIEGGYNENGIYSIKISGNGNIESGIYQKIYISDTVPHKFYIYARNIDADENGVAKLVLFNEDFTNRIYEQKLTINSDNWQKIEFEVPVFPNYYSYNFAITYKGSGSIEIDEASYMPSNNVFGIRKEYADFFRIWKPGMMRYPGGGFADAPTNFWLYSVGQIDKRNPMIYGHKTKQRLDMGTDEFMKICREFNMEPNLVTNINRSAEEAANWVEYCNGDTNTILGKLRKQNGNAKPYNVKYWEIGNENWYNLSDYAEKYLASYKQMKKTDSSIRAIINGNHWDNNFDVLMPLVGDKCDIYTFHPMGGTAKKLAGSDNEKLYYAVLASNTINTIQDLEKKIKEFYPNLRLASGEWWSSYLDGDYEYVNWLHDTVARNHSLEAALWNATEYINYIRNPHILEFCSRTVGIGMIKRSINKKGQKIIWANPSFHGLSLIFNHSGNYVVENEVNCNTYHCWESDYWANETPYLEVVTTISKDTLYVAVVNRHANENILTNVVHDYELTSENAKVYELWSEHYLDYASADEPNKILPTEKIWKIEDTYSFPKHSLTILAIPVKVDTGVIDSTKKSVYIYPNPAQNNFTISLPSKEYVTSVEIHNALGEKTLINDINQLSNLIPININLPTGIYVVKVNYINGSIHEKIVINKY